MAVHRSRRRDNRAYPVYTGFDSPQGVVHVGQTKVQNRLRIHLPIPVSISCPIHTISTEAILINTPTTYSLIIFTLLHLFNLRSALTDADITLAAVEPTLWLQVEVHYALVACSVFCLRPFMAAVSTNYGTAGDSTLESSVNRSGDTKGSSKSGSGSGSNTNSRSRSLSRVRRKRAGTMSPSQGGVPRSLPKGGLCQDGVRHVGWMSLPAPIRRSLFPLGIRDTQSPARAEKEKDGLRSMDSHPTLLDVDAIELMPQLQRQHARKEGDGPFEAVDSERMVIRKEVQYSIQYEYDEEQRRGQSSKEASSDATAYV